MLSTTSDNVPLGKRLKTSIAVRGGLNIFELFFIIILTYVWLKYHQPRSHPKISGTTMLASDSIINFGVFISSFPHVIFSFGTAPL